MRPEHEFFRQYVTDSGEVLRYTPTRRDLAGGLGAALAGRRLQSVVPCCTCGWRGIGIDRTALDLRSAHPDADPLAQWLLRHLAP